MYKIFVTILYVVILITITITYNELFCFGVETKLVMPTVYMHCMVLHLIHQLIKTSHFANMLLLVDPSSRNLLRKESLSSVPSSPGYILLKGNC
jgi:hypothetical protein